MGKDSYTTHGDSRRRDEAEKDHRSKRRKRDSHSSRGHADSERPRESERRDTARQPDSRHKDPDKVGSLIPHLHFTPCL